MPGILLNKIIEGPREDGKVRLGNDAVSKVSDWVDPKAKIEVFKFRNNVVRPKVKAVGQPVHKREPCVDSMLNTVKFYLGRCATKAIDPELKAGIEQMQLLLPPLSKLAVKEALREGKQQQ